MGVCHHCVGGSEGQERLLDFLGPQVAQGQDHFQN